MVSETKSTFGNLEMRAADTLGQLNEQRAWTRGETNSTCPHSHRGPGVLLDFLVKRQVLTPDAMRR